MNTEQLTYKTIESPTSFNHKVLGSKHIAFLEPVKTEEAIRQLLQAKRKEHHSATHVCYAWRLKNGVFRSADDGEPSGTAGKPILNQLLHFELQDALLMVVRYFGGTKLGTGGLMDAYKQAAKGAIEGATIIELPLLCQMAITLEYSVMPSVMALLKQYETQRVSFRQEDKVHIVIEVKKNMASPLEDELAKLDLVEISLSSDII
jgi:uncharacterized YigZ family protein